MFSSRAAHRGSRSGPASTSSSSSPPSSSGADYAGGSNQQPQGQSGAGKEKERAEKEMASRTPHRIHDFNDGFDTNIAVSPDP